MNVFVSFYSTEIWFIKNNDLLRSKASKRSTWIHSLFTVYSYNRPVVPKLPPLTCDLWSADQVSRTEHQQLYGLFTPREHRWDLPQLLQTQVNWPSLLNLQRCTWTNAPWRVAARGRRPHVQFLVKLVHVGLGTSISIKRCCWMVSMVREMAKRKGAWFGHTAQNNPKATEKAKYRVRLSQASVNISFTVPNIYNKVCLNYTLQVMLVYFSIPSFLCVSLMSTFHHI